jgi:hypothetical protein
MVTEYGMSQGVGSVHLGDASGQPTLLGQAMGLRREYSEETAQAIDHEVSNLVESLRRKVVRILEANRNVLEDMAQRLLAVEVIETSELKRLLERVRPLSEDDERAKLANGGFRGATVEGPATAQAASPVEAPASRPPLDERAEAPETAPAGGGALHTE